jgi:hypothetical protein
MSMPGQIRTLEDVRRCYAELDRERPSVRTITRGVAVISAAIYEARDLTAGEDEREHP